MTDLTKITTPFGLLDEETQRALKECGGPWEIYQQSGEWLKTIFPEFLMAVTYRHKPQPREYIFWLVIEANGMPWGSPWTDKSWAVSVAADIGGRVIKLTGQDDS